MEAEKSVEVFHTKHFGSFLKFISVKDGGLFLRFSEKEKRFSSSIQIKDLLFGGALRQNGS